MNDLLEDANEMQEVLSRSYGVCPEVGDDELEAGCTALHMPSAFHSRATEFEGLGDLELDDIPDTISTPGVPTTVPGANKAATPSGPVKVDEFGLPEL